MATSAKYLGIHMANDLTRGKHITQVTNKAGKVLALLKGTLRSVPQKLKKEHTSL